MQSFRCQALRSSAVMLRHGGMAMVMRDVGKCEAKEVRN